MVHHFPRQPQRILEGEDGIVALLPEVGKVWSSTISVASRRALDQRDTGVAVAGHPNDFSTSWQNWWVVASSPRQLASASRRFR
jgi:hypothetical protein